jgi:D-beta-D-heptose 7-phosphate kinase / D-beta-D-heptose 1-phosphate adenosyltransferase
MTRPLLAPADLLDAFPRVRALVVGDVVLDEWLSGGSREISREAPVPTVRVEGRTPQPGGAGNAAANLAAMGARVDLVSAVGSDPAAAAVLDTLGRTGVDRRGLVLVPARRTPVKRRLVVNGQVLARFDEGDVGCLDAAADALVARAVEDCAATADVVLVADYGLGTCAGPQVCSALREIAGHRPLVLDAHDLRRWVGLRPTVATPNWQEVQPLMADESTDRVAAVARSADLLLRATGAGSVVVTLDVDGAVVVDGGRVQHVPVQRVERAHPAGAGDAFSAALALGLAVGADLGTSVEVAVAAGGAVVRRPGTAVCTARDLRTRFGSPLVAGEELVRLLAADRAAGRRIAFTNGCFDLLHPGHVQVLQAAARLADVVVVGLNTDSGVRRLKGPGRPVNTLADRASVVAALGGVDHLVEFDDDAPLALLRAVRPDVYVKGGDHDVDLLPEAELVREQGGVVHTVAYLPERSTSGMIAACRRAAVAAEVPV